MRITGRQLDLLCSTFLFRGVEREEIRSLLSDVNGGILRFERGQAIFTRTSFERGIGIVLAGSIRVSKGNGSMVVSVLKQGDLFGAATLFSNEASYVSDLEALSTCKVLFFSEAEMEQVFMSSPALAMNYIRYLSNRVRFLSGRVDMLIRRRGEGPLAEYLEEHADAQGKVKLDCSYSQLAVRFNISRATLYRELKRLEETGMISRENNELVVNRQTGGEGE